ncbi:glycosyltransferase family 4 protein [Tessaracoccus rhinocerotis]|uniref:Glycosyltransferase family 4 protein n=1 Tax=Tessaracoccus rhinocerotis TaxID=1689449 RepID=A0A553JZC2_9ACTN|nr:glycosyltransferase [Tessaracoccus rhinocerotis]TRY17801.1 glycosyltransferase family 4 protein [Tessaracoccus rhinocerotis]
MTDTPRVVLFRHAPVDIDSRVKKFAITLQRAGYEPVVISVEPLGGTAGEFVLGDGIRVIRVPLQNAPQKTVRLRRDNLEARRALHRRRAAYRERVRGADAASAKAGAKWALTTAKVAALKAASVASEASFRIQRAVAHRASLRDPFVAAAVERNLPVVSDVTHTLTDLLVELKPDVLHAHHPQVLLATREALKQLRAQGVDVKFYYDARENFAGIPAKEQGNQAAHQALLACEAAMIGEADAVSTVSEPIAEVLQKNNHLGDKPSVFLNMPPLGELTGPTTVREAAGLGDDVPLVVYSGTMSWARGIEAMVEGIKHMPEDAHLVVVSVPLPHPMIPKLELLAQQHGVAERLHFVGPVSQNELLHYLSGADVAIHPLPGGSPNHDAAMPNKLFEYLHAGLPLVVSDAKLMAKFVSQQGVGRVFTSEDPESLGKAVTSALAEPPSQRVAEVAAAYSWQGQEGRIVELYNSITGYDGRTPRVDEPFGSLEVRPAP